MTVTLVVGRVVTDSRNSLSQLPFASRSTTRRTRGMPGARSRARKDTGMRYTTTFALAAVLLFNASLASAQKAVNFSVGGGVTTPNSDVRDRFGNGYNFNFGVQANVTPVIAIEGLYSFNGLGSKDHTINVFPQPSLGGGVPTDISANMNMQYGTGSLIVEAPHGSVRTYGLVGIGVSYRPVEVTTPGVGWVPGYCNPWWYVCYPGGWVETTNILGSRSSTDFGMVFGGGVHFGMVYAELRYHYIWGPEVQVNTPAQPIAGVD